MSAPSPSRVALVPMGHAEAATWLMGSIRRYAAGAAGSSSLDLAAATARGERVVGEVLPQGPATPGHAVCRVTLGDEDVGSVWFGPPGDGADELYLWDLLIDAEHRGRGLGRLVLEALLVEARRRGTPRVRLNVFAGNAAARSLYERSGFRVDAEQDGYISMIADVPDAG